MKLVIASLLTAAAAVALVGCGGGGGGSGPTDTLTQAQHDTLAQEFIKMATTEGLDYTLVKQDTQTQGYIVVETSQGTYDAFFIDNWNGTTAVSTLTPNYSALAPIGNNNYQVLVPDGYNQYGWICCDSEGNDYYGDEGYVDTSYYLTFTVAQPTSKDLEKMAAFEQAYTIGASAQKIQSQFGVTLERATEVAKLAIQVKNTPNMSDSDYDNLSQQLLGVPLTKLDAAVGSNNASSADANDVINSAATTNGVGPEQARSLLNSLMSPSH